MRFQRAHTLPPSTFPEQRKISPLATQSFTLHAQQSGPLAQEEAGNEAFRQHKYEATVLEIKAQSSALAPEQRERLGELQAKMKDFWAQRIERASRFDYSFVGVPVHRPEDGRAGAIATQPKESKTGLPYNLKTGAESLSGLSLDDVKVHYHSSKPAQLQALAYTQGAEIHIGSRQENHLPHELWHVVQQKQGRVKPTLQVRGMAINGDEGLEREADVMGAKALSPQRAAIRLQDVSGGNLPGATIQCVLPGRVRDRLMEREQADPENLQGLTLCIEAVDAMLDHARLRYRIGGSLAAHLHGAPRRPADVDIEVGNDHDRLAAADALQRGTTWFQGSPQEVSFQSIGSQVGPMVAVVEMAATERATGRTRRFPVDIVNENNPVFNQDLVAPHRRGVHPGTGDLVEQAELIVSYLDRMIRKPDVAARKGDEQQIIYILAEAGFNPRNQAHWLNLQNHITPLVEPRVLHDYLGLLQRVLRVFPVPMDE